MPSDKEIRNWKKLGLFEGDDDGRTEMPMYCSRSGSRVTAILSEMLAKEYLAQGEKEKALQNLQKSLEIKRIIYDHGDEEVMRIVKQMDRRPLRIETGM